MIRIEKPLEINELTMVATNFINDMCQSTEEDAIGQLVTRSVFLMYWSCNQLTAS